MIIRSIKTMRSNKLIPMLFMVLIIALIVSGCGSYKPDKSSKVNSDSSENTNDAQSIGGSTEDWVVFRDELNGFEFKHPKTATVENDLTFWQNDERSAETMKRFKAAYTLWYIENGESYSIDIQISESLGDDSKEFTKWSKFEDTGSGTTDYLTFLNSKMYNFFMRGDKNSLKEREKTFLKKIVDTVKFFN